jgi:riboflavin synthase alpha subunit
VTTLGALRVSDALNIKTDGLAKYFQRQFLLDRE